MELTFVKTCEACPEQYDVFDENAKQVAYVRLRWGTLRVDVPDYGGKTIYLHVFDNGYKGAFDNQEESEHYLNIIERKIKECYNEANRD